jgi:hypothetical protein
MDVTNSDGMVLRVHEFRSDEFQARHEEQADRKRHMFHNATRYCQRPNCDFYELQYQWVQRGLKYYYQF